MKMVCELNLSFLHVHNFKDIYPSYFVSIFIFVMDFIRLEWTKGNSHCCNERSYTCNQKSIEKG